MPVPIAPMVSGMRAPDDSLNMISGMPLATAVRRMCAIFLTLIGLDEALLTVMSCDTMAASRPSTRPYPQTLPSAGVSSRVSGLSPVANLPASRNEPGSHR